MSAPTRAAAAFHRTAASTPGIPVDWRWASCAVLAAVLLAVAAFLPLWELTLRAPQYPGGLNLTAYGTRMDGDLREINALNHYVGIKPIKPETVVELQIFPFAVGALVVALLGGAFFARRRLYRVALAAAVWAVPLGLLADLQWWLHRYGQDIEPYAAIRLQPFTPKVIGTTEVINFHSETMVTTGFWLMIAAALLITVGPWLIRFVQESWANTGEVTRAAAALLVFGATALALPTGSTAAASEPPLSIGAAIAAAAAGDTIVIPAGTYVEQVVIDKPLVLVGEGRPVIDGGGRGDVVVIAAPDVTLRGFDVRRSARAVTDEPAGIRVTADRATIEDNRLEGVLYGISLEESGGHRVTGNYIASMLDLPAERRGHALYLWYSEDNVLSHNVIEYAKDGIFLGFATRTTVEGNVVSRVRYGLHTMYAYELVLRGNVFRDNIAGASLMYSRDLSIIDNEFSANRSAASGYGLLFKDMDDVELVGNRIHHNRLGLTMEGAPRTPGATVVLRDNLFAFNQIAMELFTTTSATFTGNSFIGNLQQVETRGGSLEHRNAWSLDGRGNYWDDYRGYDARGDGIGDIPYRYEGTFDDLVRRNEAVRAYAFTPARSALDLAARWFPVHQPQPRVVDPHPLMSPPMTLRSAEAEANRVTSGAAGVALVASSLAVFGLAARRFGRRWA